MKGIKWTLIVSLSALVVCGLGGTALAFHSSGVAECSGCHTMHNSEGGNSVRTLPGAASYLLREPTPSDTCLTCHAAYGQGAGGAGYGSGGDFYWITKTFEWMGRHDPEASKGDNHGHNINSSMLNIQPDATLTAAPGGSYLSSKLGCNSCHDPHGKQHNALLLYGAESVTAENYPGGYAFSNPAPILKSPGRTTASSSAVSNAKHTAFGSGMSAWCANCHGAMTSGHVHPVNQALNSTYVSNYNAYVSTADKTSGLDTNSYREKVPFETGETVQANMTTATTTSTAGPAAGTSKVMCLSCHRSHASAYPYAGRWDFGADDISLAHPVATDNGVSAADVLNKNYGEVFVAGQKSLCNKCHVKD